MFFIAFYPLVPKSYYLFNVCGLWLCFSSFWFYNGNRVKMELFVVDTNNTLIKNNQKWNKILGGHYWKVNEGIKALRPNFPRGNIHSRFQKFPGGSHWIS